ncbi:B12-binding domain-containing radical SAM protein [Candidatus Omnitrophota bacterium]
MSFRIVFFNIADFFEKSRFPSLGLAYLASYLRTNSSFNEIHIIEGDGLNKIKKLKPDLIAISSVTQRFKEATALAGLIKKKYKNIPIIIGGHHISALPYTLPACFDVGVLGEGEATLVELVELIVNYGFRSDKLSAIKGIVFHNGNEVVVNARRGLIDDIDSIPFPARDLLVTSRFSSILTSRGCPYECIFCASVNFWKKPRFHSAQYVVDEIEEMIKKYKAVHISIWDDLFIADRRRLETICDLINKRKINRKVSFGCALRSNLVNSELCFLLKKMNVKRVSIGFESGSQKILNLLKCGSVTVEQHIKAVELCKTNNFYTTGTFMIGSPGEGREDLLKTLALIKKLKLNGGGTVTMTVPLPGTQLWEYAKQKRLITDEADSMRSGIMVTDFSKPKDFKGFLLTDRISKEEFFKIAQEIQKETNKYYVRGLLRRENISFRNFIFFLSRPKEVISIFKFILKFLIRKASIMERYAYYYKKNNS